MKRIVVIGSTGSIGRQTLEVARAFPDQFEVVGLAAGQNRDLFLKQVAEFRPKYVYCAAPLEAAPSRTTFASLGEMAALTEVDLVMVATVGTVGLLPTLIALRQGKRVALSNKEPIVMAGQLLKECERKHSGVILPVDSEPSAIWQCLQGEVCDISRLVITASGGPFRLTPPDQLPYVTPAQALKHPTWQMGPKITIDSATLMNKAFEVIESRWLFNVPWDKIEAVIHPQSIIHSMVELADGSLKAQMGPPDMKLPIQYAMFYPERRPNPQIPRLDTRLPWQLTFEPLEPNRYPCFDLALDVARRGGTYPAALAAADEVAVNSFLSGQIRFTDIYKVVEQTLELHQPTAGDDVEELLAVDQQATRQAQEIAKRSVWTQQ